MTSRDKPHVVERVTGVLLRKKVEPFSRFFITSSSWTLLRCDVPDKIDYEYVVPTVTRLFYNNM